MVGQASKAADMRAGNVAKPGMKAMNGGGGSMSRSTQKYVAPKEEKAKPKPKATSHSQMVQQWEANGRDANGKLIKHVEKKSGWTKDEINAARDRAAEERRRQVEASTVKTIAASDAGEELEIVPDGEQAHVLARARMADLAETLESLTLQTATDGAGTSSSSNSEEDASSLWAAFERRRSQLEELECLEAMFVDEFRLVTSVEAVAALREQCESLGDDAGSADVNVLRTVVEHSPLEFSLQLTANGERSKPVEAAASSADDEEAKEVSIPMVASILLRVTFPREYPSVPPSFHVEDAMVTTQEHMARDKMLATRATVQEEALCKGMREKAEESLPDPCVFEAATWLIESAFEFVGQAWV